MLYQPNFAVLRGAIEDALHSKKGKQKHQWRVISINQSWQSSSVYTYLLRNGRLSFIRFSDHNAPTGNPHRLDLFVPHPDSGRALHDYITKDKNDILNTLNNIAVNVDLPFVLIIKAIAKTYKAPETFLLRYGHLYITHPRREITDGLVLQDVECLIDIGLVACREDGHLSVTHSGLDVLKKYSSYSRDDWPRTLTGYTCDELLGKLGHYLKRKIAWESSSERLTPPAGWNITPKVWRNWGETVANNVDWYPYRILATISPARRRSLYFYLYSPREARLALLRAATTEVERTQVGELPREVSNTLLMPDKRIKWVKKVFGQVSFQYLSDKDFKNIHLHLYHFVWLKMVDWVSHHHAKIELKEDNVVIVKRGHDGRLIAVYCLPNSQKHWVEGLENANLVKITNKPRLTPLGRLVLEQYEATRPYQNTQWKKGMLSAASRYDLLHMLTSNNQFHGAIK